MVCDAGVMRNAIVVRKRFTAAERARALEEYRASGLTQREFAARVGISAGSLYNWLRRDRNGSSPAGKVSFLEIPASTARPVAGYKVHFPDGLAVEAPRGFAPAELKEVLRLAREL